MEERTLKEKETNANFDDSVFNVSVESVKSQSPEYTSEIHDQSAEFQGDQDGVKAGDDDELVEPPKNFADASLIESTTSEECCCCSTFVRGMSRIGNEICALQDAVLEKGSLNSTIIEDKNNPQNADINPCTTKEKYKWEKSSSGAARKAVNFMGYRGKGLGKNESGIEEALTAESIYCRHLKERTEETRYSCILL